MVIEKKDLAESHFKDAIWFDFGQCLHLSGCYPEAALAYLNALNTNESDFPI